MFVGLLAEVWLAVYILLPLYAAAYIYCIGTVYNIVTKLIIKDKLYEAT
jgi:hypothetical protein